MSVPTIVTGIINGDEDAWSRAFTLLGDYYSVGMTPRSCIDTITSADPYADDVHLEATDLVALGALGIRLPVRISTALLHDAHIRNLEEQIPTILDLVDADDDLIGEGSPAWHLWQLLTSTYGLEWKSAEALMARLRPSLFPVMTGTERKTWGVSKDMPHAWQMLRDLLRDADARLSYQLHYLVETAPVWSGLSQLQVLQALIYTDASDRHEQERIRKAQQKAQKKLYEREKKLRAKQEKRLASPTVSSTQHTTSANSATQISTDAVLLQDG